MTRALLRRTTQQPEHVDAALRRHWQSRAEVARAIGISPSHLTEIARGTRNATPQVLEALALGLDLPVSMLERHERPAWLEQAVGA